MCCVDLHRITERANASEGLSNEEQWREPSVRLQKLIHEHIPMEVVSGNLANAALLFSFELLGLLYMERTSKFIFPLPLRTTCINCASVKVVTGKKGLYAMFGVLVLESCL